MSKERTCINCKWSRYSGPHLGCYYNYKWQFWLKKTLAKIFPICEIPDKEYLRELGCKWEAIRGQD